MASINFNPFGENWFKKPPIPIQPINLQLLTESLKNPFKPKPTSDSSPFASISNPFTKKSKLDPDPDTQRPKPGTYKKLLEQFYYETETRPDYRHTPEVEKILNEDPFFIRKDNPTQEEIEENERWLAGFRDNPVVKFLTRAEEVADELNEMELKANSEPYRMEDKKYWKSIPNVVGPDGRPMVRKAIRTKKESDDKFWDFAKQFFFGLWGFRQRPYPPGRPIDVAQAVGYKRLEKRYYDCKFLILAIFVVN